jgi:hypothetical protein
MLSRSSVMSCLGCGGSADTSGFDRSPVRDYALTEPQPDPPHFAGYRSPERLWGSAITERFGGSSGSPRSSVWLLVGPAGVELDAEQHDDVVGDELADDHGGRDEGATDDPAKG